MATAIMPEINGELVIPAVSSSYPTLGNAYRHGGYTVSHSGSLESIRLTVPSMVRLPVGMTVPASNLETRLWTAHAAPEPYTRFLLLSRSTHFFNEAFNVKV